MGKVMEELLHDRLVERDARSRNEGRTSAFAELVRDGVMSLSEAAKLLLRKLRCYNRNASRPNDREALYLIFLKIQLVHYIIDHRLQR